MNKPFATSMEKTMEQKRDARPGNGRRSEGAGRKPGQRLKPDEEGQERGLRGRGDDTGIDTGENNVDETDTEIGGGPAGGRPRSRGRGDRRINR